jgi:alkanesulfonate monooxygenase SsuD/methylene tetrahydromethanopterin reductase-like flavin-dependent oxidoreductase (luciferase family)
VSGRKRPAMRRAARLADGWMPYLVSPDAYARSVQAVRGEADAVGRDLDGFEWLLFCYCVIRPDGDQAREERAAFLGSAYGDKPPEMLDRIAPAGTPDEVAGHLQAYVDAGVRHVVIAPATRTDTLEVVQLAAEEILPRLNSSFCDRDVVPEHHIPVTEPDGVAAAAQRVDR